MKKLSPHSEWLSLIDISGPFITISILEKAFPQGLEAIKTPRRQNLRAAYDEWREAVDENDSLLPELHREWVRLVLVEMLEYDEVVLVPSNNWLGEIPTIRSQENIGSFSPDWIVCAPNSDKPRLFISVMPPDTDLESVKIGDSWPVSMQERMTLLCREYGVRVGLMTDGERWMLVNAPVGLTSSHASWYARLWFQEPITLKAFQSLLGVRRCFGPPEETLEALLDESLKYHDEVTDTLGEQVRRAVEVLVQCLDKADQDHNRELLKDVKPTELYEAGLTVMMRLVFILCAEERGLLLLGDSVYDQSYAVSTLRGQLEEDADRHGPEVLDIRHDAWARLLTVFRAIYGGIEHEALRMPALGGSLFDPDRFPFLEGRAKGTSWLETTSAPLPIDNRTVLLLLNSLQILEQAGGAMLLSYRALDVEQIGHVYEGLLENTVVRVPCVTLGLIGSQKAKNPNISLTKLESARLEGDNVLINLIGERTKRSESAIRKGLTKPIDEFFFAKVQGVCGGDTEFADRIRPFANLIRADAWEDPIVYKANSLMVTLGADRRETGTHYTPKSLTESIVTTTLEPIVYVGPAEGRIREEWTLKSSQEILELKVCDPAMGSGAFLVQVCRYLGEKLVEAWLHEETSGKVITFDGEALDDLDLAEPMPVALDERMTIARRLVAERCLYGVDINPLAVELAKLSIWLVTLAKGRPFGFLDHNLRSGDSLLGIHRLDQLTYLTMKPESGRHQYRIFGQNIEAAVKEALELRKKLRSIPIRDIHNVEVMAQLDLEARKKLESVELIADAMIGEALWYGGNTRELDTAFDSLTLMVGDYLGGNEIIGEQIDRNAKTKLSVDLSVDKLIRIPFHWALEFPEVFIRGGFNAMVGNPPFMGGRKISSSAGISYLTFLTTVRDNINGIADLVCHFFRRSFDLLMENGALGLLATKSISEVDSRRGGLGAIASEGGTIFCAVVNQPWPGKAAVVVSSVHVSKGFFAKKTLNGKAVDLIPPSLQEEPIEEIEPKNLSIYSGKGRSGSKIMGDGFKLTLSEAKEIVFLEPKIRPHIKELLGGTDITTIPDQKPSRMVIDPGQINESELKNFPIVYNRLKEMVFPTRNKSNDVAKKKYWWRFAGSSAALYKEIENLNCCIVCSRVTKHIMFQMVPTKSTWGPLVFDESVVAFAFDDFFHFGCLHSTHHCLWVTKWGSKMGTTQRYTPTEVFETFPFPPNEECEDIKTSSMIIKRYRDKIMQDRGEGLTGIYNLIHNQNVTDLDIVKMRDLQVAIDIAVQNAYGWGDLNLDHGFYNVPYLPMNDCKRFTFSDDMRIKILHRLSDLNQKQFKEEIQNETNRKINKKNLLMKL